MVLARSYVGLGRLESAQRLQEELSTRMPWLSAILPVFTESGASPTNISLETQRSVIWETKRAWSLAEQVRSRLNELLSEFLVSSTLRQQLAIVSSAQKLIDHAISSYIGESANSSEGSVVANVRTNLAAEVILEAGHYIAVMEENLKADQRGEPPIRTRIDRTDGEVRAVSQGFQSAEEVRQVFSYFRSQVEKAAAEQPKVKSPRRQRSTEGRKESNSQDSTAPPKDTSAPYLGIALSTMVAAILIFTFTPTWLRNRLIKLMPEHRKAVESASILEEELLLSGPRKEKAGKRKRGNSAKTSISPLISLIEEPPSVELDLPVPEIDALNASIESFIPTSNKCSDEPAPASLDLVSEPPAADTNLSAFLTEELIEETGEWISASHSKPSRLKRSLSNTVEAHPRQQQTKRQISQSHQKESKSRIGSSSGDRARVDKVTRNTATSSKHQNAEKKQESAVSAEQPPASSGQRPHNTTIPERQRTPSPTDVREVQSPTKGPFDHINVKWMAPPIGSTTNTRIIPDEEISDCSESSYSQSSPNEVTHDHEQVTLPPQHFPVMIPVPVYYVPAPMNFNQMHDQQGPMVSIPFVPPFDYYHGMHLPPQPVPDHIALLNAVRAQIEYYFSTENLCRDVYLRGMMDAQGYVKLTEICKFNRIRSFGAPPLMILEAVASSNVVSLLESPAVCAAKGNFDLLSRLKDSDILESKIRPSANPEIWPKRNSISASKTMNDQ